MIQAQVDFAGLKGVQDDLAFEIIRAITLTARDASLAVRAQMPEKFLLRRSWIVKGIRFEPARKSDPVARVFSVDPYMTKQEEGEEYTAAGSHVAIPAGVRASPRDLIPLSMYPRNLRGRKDIFKAQGNGGWGLFQRTGKQLRILYLLRDRKRTRPRWGFAESAQKAVDERFERHLQNL